MSVTELLVNEKVREKLGEDGLRDVTACLWAVDCQTCGGFLGTDPPVLCVDDMMVFAVASLHHQRCRIPDWNDSGMLQGVSADHLSFITRMVSLPFLSEDGREVQWPMMLVNPGLESVSLKPDASGQWRMHADAELATAGLVHPSSGFALGVPIEGVIARIMNESIAVTLEVAPFSSYEAPADSQTLECARARGGVLLGVTHALHPGDFTKEDLQGALADPRTLAGWVGVHGTRSAPLQKAPAQGITCVLHWNDRHMSVGALIGRASKVLTSGMARSWAERMIRPDDDAQGPRKLMPWKLVDEDRPNDGWYTSNPFSCEQYFLRRHSDGWKLVRAFSQMDGDTVESDNEARAWAGNVLKFRTGVSGLTWEPGPTTPGSTTLYASA